MVDDAVREPGRGADVMRQLAETGFRAVRLTSFWEPGLTAPTPEEVETLRRVASEAGRRDVRIYVAVFQPGSATTPLTPEARAQFSSYAAGLVREVPELRDVIVGNEPNLNRFWMPQFGPAGENVAAPAYLELLAETYDALKAVSEDVRVYGGALSPRGIDRPNTGRDTHSPTTFIRDLGAAYRASGRDRPVMDAFAFHPYPDSADTVDRRHPSSTTIGIADVGKLVGLLGEAFDGTAQRGSELPILLTEFGIETAIPAGKQALYVGEEPASVTDEATQAAAYRRALELAGCSRNVAGILLFHSHDEADLRGWQSGVYYLDGTPKASRDPVAAAVEDARAGELGGCWAAAP